MRRARFAEDLVFGFVLEHLHAVRFDPLFVLDTFGSHRHLTHFLRLDPLANLHGNLVDDAFGDRAADGERHLADFLMVLHAKHFLRNPLRDHFVLVAHHLDGHLLRDRTRDVLRDRHLLRDHVGNVLLLDLVGPRRLRGNPVQTAAAPHGQPCRWLGIVGAREPSQPSLNGSRLEGVAVHVAALIDVLGCQRGLLFVGSDLLLLHHGVGHRATHHLLLLVNPFFPHRPLHHVAFLPRLGLFNVRHAIIRFLAILGFPNGPPRHMPLFTLVCFNHRPSDLVSTLPQFFLPNRLVDRDSPFDKRGLIFQSIDRHRTLVVDRLLHDPILPAFSRLPELRRGRLRHGRLRHGGLRGRGPHAPRSADYRDSHHPADRDHGDP